MNNDDKVFAIELTKALIKNNNVKPTIGYSNDRDIGDENSIKYIIGDTIYSFSDLVSHFIDNIERIKRWE